MSLGSCSVCGGDASVTYPLLSGSPSFCSTHHNQGDAGGFGCDFTGPDDFDIPDMFEDIDLDTSVWTTRDGKRIPLEKLETSHLDNIINLLERSKKNFVVEEWLDALKEEGERRVT